MLEKLKQYKELIAVIVFFLGGFIWLNNQYPTKSDLKVEFKYLDCQLEKYMTLTQLQIRGQDIEKQAQDLATRISDMGTNSGDVHLSPAMKFELDKHMSDFEHNRERKRSNQLQIVKITDALARNVCRKVNE